MARIKYSGLIESINGSIGGTTFQTNRYGFTVKRKPVPSKPNTPSQNARKTAMFAVQQAWIGLTAANRAAWNTYASTYPRPTRLNINSNLNGFNYFLAYHLIRRQHDTVTLANPSGVQRTFSFVSSDILSDGGALDWQFGIIVSGGTWIALVSISRVVTLTTQARKNRIRFVDSKQVTGSSSLVITNPYTALFGSIPVPNDYVFLQEVWLNTANGQIFTGQILRRQVTI